MRDAEGFSIMVMVVEEEEEQEEEEEEEEEDTPREGGERDFGRNGVYLPS